MVEMVAVACKMARGVKLNLNRYAPSPPGQVPKIERVKKTYTLQGTHTVRNVTRSDKELVGGYAITQIPKDFWDEWAERNAASPFITQKLIIAHAKLESVMAEAKNNKLVPELFAPADPPKQGKDGKGIGKFNPKD